MEEKNIKKVSNRKKQHNLIIKSKKKAQKKIVQQKQLKLFNTSRERKVHKKRIIWDNPTFLNH